MLLCENVTKYYNNNKKNPTIKDINLSIKKGTIHGIIGHNGSGKTTLIKCITGIYQPNSGIITIGGELVYNNIAIKDKIGYVADSNQFFPSYRVNEMIKFFRGMYSGFSMEKFEEMNQFFQVDNMKRISQLSKGQQMRLSFMLNMAIQPEVLVLDEPTSGLDAMAKKELLNIIVNDVEERGTTVLISSHHLSELERICDSITILKQGEIQYSDEIDKVKNKIKKFQVVFKNGVPDDFLKLPEIVHISNVGRIYTVLVDEEFRNFEQKVLEEGADLVESLDVNLEEMFIYSNLKEEEK